MVDTYLQGTKYLILRYISSGGFGCTYEGMHVLLKKRIAIKEFFVKDFCNRDEKTSRVSVGTLSKRALVDKLKGKFIDEARAMSQFQHPNIVHVSDVFEENGTAYYVMDYIDGSSVSQIIKEKGSIPEAQALKYICQIADALKYVHNNKRLHLDIKPSNIMVDSKDNAVLIDFGTSKQYEEEGGENTSTLGGLTPGYAPIEQMGNSVTKFLPATDIYALGATLYKMLTGTTPLAATMRASGEDMPPLPPYISERTRTAITIAMSVRKSDRPQTMDEFLALLNETPRVPRPDYDYQSTGYPEDERTVVVEDKVEVVNAEKIDTSHEGQVDEKKEKNHIWLYFLFGFVVAAIITVILIVSFNSSSPNADNIPDSTAAVVDTVIFTNSRGVEFDYVGSYNAEGTPDGKGLGRYENGKYEGEYKNGLRHGQGSFETSDGENTFKGTFENDFYKEGTLWFKDNSYFIGTFKGGNPWNGEYYHSDNTPDCKIVNGEVK